jgi:hypothetical protein
MAAIAAELSRYLKWIQELLLSPFTGGLSPYLFWRPAHERATQDPPPLPLAVERVSCQGLKHYGDEVRPVLEKLLKSEDKKMPYIVTTSVYPSDKVSEVAKRYLEALTKYPPDESLATQIVPAAVKGTHVGIEVIGILEVKKGKLEEAYLRTVNMMAMFHRIQGFEYTIETYLKVEEAMAVIGMSMPK